MRPELDRDTEGRAACPSWLRRPRCSALRACARGLGVRRGRLLARTGPGTATRPRRTLAPATPTRATARGINHLAAVRADAAHHDVVLVDRELQPRGQPGDGLLE